MNGKKIGILLGILCVLLFVGNGFLYLQRRESKPEIIFGKDAPVYTSESSDEELLSNVKASDPEDGDLTDHVIVDQIVKKDNYVKVTYLVTDSDNHVVTNTQKLKRKDSAADSKKSDSTDSAQQSPQDANSQVAAELTPTEAPENVQNTESADSAQEGDGAADGAQGTVDAAEEAVDGAQAAQDAVTPQEEQTPTEEPVDPAIPVITLNTDHATVKAGETFQYGEYIDQITDDKDSLDTLGRAIHVDGADTATPGEKEVHYYVFDSDGHQSKEVILKLTVE